MKKLRLLLITLCVSVLMGSMAVTAYAGGGEKWDGLAPVEPLPDETVDLGEGFTEEGNLVTRDLLYDKATNKQFITVQTSGGKAGKGHEQLFRLCPRLGHGGLPGDGG